MKLLDVTIRDPKQPIDIRVPPKVAARVIRAWFCTKGVPASTLKVMQEHLNPYYPFNYDTEGIIRYRSVPRIAPGENIERYSWRVTSFVRIRLGRDKVGDLLGMHAHENYDYR